jgi:hypothetical protein
MLEDFLTTHRAELLRRCKEKVAKRFGAGGAPTEVGQGVPLFLRQLTNVLIEERLTASRCSDDVSVATGMSKSAASHGAELLGLGYTVEQVVHEYGDVCQSVTELAFEQNVAFSTDEFRILNRCLDNAIADAVGSYGLAGKTAQRWRDINLKERLDKFAAEYRRLLNTAEQAFASIQTGSIGPGGSTGVLLAHTLAEMRYLGEHGILEIPWQSTMEDSKDDDTKK